MDAMDPVHLSSELMSSNNAGGTPPVAEGTTPPEEKEETKLWSQELLFTDGVTELVPRSTDEELLMQLWDLEHPGLLLQFGIELEEMIPNSCEALCKAWQRTDRSIIRERYLAPGVACFVVFPADHHDDDDDEAE